MIEQRLARNRVVALIGPRQCGKTTIARELLSPESINYFDLEDPLSLARLEQPMTALQDLRGLVVIDEVQRRPDLFPILRVLADRTPVPARFLVLGSASPDLLRQSSESLAGRITVIEMGGFSLAEAGPDTQNQHWLRGGFPQAFLAESDEASLEWRRDFVRTFLERDVPQFGFNIPATRLFRFWTILAHYHGQIWNTAEAARTLEVGQSTARRYVDMLQDLFMVRLLPPWFANISKRQVKSPKVYIRDSGLLHYLLGIHGQKDLLLNPRSGASWEGYALEETIRRLRPDEAYFWASQAGAELDLLIVKNGRQIGVEFKRVDAPRLTRSMKITLESLELDELLVVFPGNKPYTLGENVRALPLIHMVG